MIGASNADVRFGPCTNANPVVGRALRQAQRCPGGVRAFDCAMGDQPAARSSHSYSAPRTHLFDLHSAHHDFAISPLSLVHFNNRAGVVIQPALLHRGRHLPSR
jgi:hypothetical protein